MDDDVGQKWDDQRDLEQLQRRAIQRDVAKMKNEHRENKLDTEEITNQGGREY